MARQTQEQVEAEIAGLPALSLEALRERWRTLYGNPAPRSLRRGLLIRAVAYQLQVKAFGGLAAVTKKKLREIAVAAREGRFDPAVIGPRVKPGPISPGPLRAHSGRSAGAVACSEADTGSNRPD
jgi:hypothetical protein